jgi:hypothetical protein
MIIDFNIILESVPICQLSLCLNKRSSKTKDANEHLNENECFLKHIRSI